MRTRSKLLVLLCVALAALAAALPQQAELIAAWGALAILASWAGFELWVHRPVLHLQQCAAALAQGHEGVDIGAGRSDFGALAAALKQVAYAMAGQKNDIEVEKLQRRRAEETVRINEERYALAVGSANDAMWEWNVRADTAYFSPRWKNMLGYAEHEIEADVSEWHRRLHPEDRETALSRLGAYLDGQLPKYESEQRLRHRDGTYKWVMVRAVALRDAQGKAYRLVALSTDISTRKRVSDILTDMAEGLGHVRGDAFFRKLVQNFARVLGVERAFITICAEGSAQVRMLAQWDREQFVTPISYELTNTPCEEVLRDACPKIYPREVGKLFPREAGYESYIGIPILDSRQRVLGHLVCLNPTPLEEDFPVDQIFALYSVRAGLELERSQLLEGLNAAA